MLESVASNGLTLAYSKSGYSGTVILNGEITQTFVATAGSSSKTITITLTYDQYSVIDYNYKPLEEIVTNEGDKVTGSSNVKDLQTSKKWIKASDFNTTVFTVTQPYKITTVKID